MSKVLVATADGGYLSVLEAEIEAEGHTVLWASDGQQAHEMTLSEAPELVLLDLSLPVFNGLETAEALRADPEVPADLPIILATDEDLHPHILERSGVTLHMPKSHAAQELRDVLVDYVLGYRKH